MLGNLTNRVEKLETMAGTNTKTSPKVVRIVTTDEEEASVERLAREAGLESNDILIIRLIGVTPTPRQ